MFIVQLVFWICLLGILHSYIFYPLLLKILDVLTKKQEIVFDDHYQPHISILMSVYNEEAVILKKLQSISSSLYPMHKMSIYIGSDCSDDGSNEIIENFIKEKKEYFFFSYKDRSGKIGVIQRLIEELKKTHPISKEHIFLFTDANVLLEENTISNLVRHFINNKVALVDTNMINLGISEDGISKAEETYIAGEVMLKHREGRLWGYMMGAFGGCFAIRSNYCATVPQNFIVDDFFITMSAMQKGGIIINDLEAKCYEAIPNDMWEEYRRKRRISSGNYQNLFYFKDMLFSRPWIRAFVFFSHKFLRWIVPVLLLIGLVCLWLLYFENMILYNFMLVIWITIIFVIPILDLILHKAKVHIPILRKVRYFIFMNIALFHGLLKFINGIKTNVWQPPKRKSID